MLHEKNNLASLETLESRLLMSSDGTPSVGGMPIGMGDSNEVYYVSPTGSPTNDGTINSPWNTVEYALSRVGGGHTIVLEPGTYGPIHIDMAYQGTADSPTVIKSQYKWQAIITGDGRQVHNVDFTYGSSWITFDGLQVTNSQIDGIKANGDNIVIENCWIHHNNENGILIVGYNNDTIINNLIEYNGSSERYDHGIYAYGTNMTVTGNIVRYNAAGGIHLWPALSNSVVSSNLVYGQAHASGVYIAPQATGLLNSFTGNIVVNNYRSLSSFGQSFGSDSSNYMGNIASLSALDAISSNEIGEYMTAGGLSGLIPQGSITGSGSVKVTYNGFGKDSDGYYIVNVLVTSDLPINLSSIIGGGLICSSANGYNQATTEITVILAPTGNNLEIVYKLAAPGGSWDYSDNGSYTIAVAAGAITDVAGNTVAAKNIRTVTVDIPATDLTPPSVSICTDGQPSGRSVTKVNVQFADNTLLTYADIQSAIVRVTGPNGFSVTGRMTGITSTMNANFITAVYEITAPGGAWNYSDNGHYTVTLFSGVSDTSGNTLQPCVIGGFDVNLAAPDDVAPTIAIANAGSSTFGTATRDFVVTYRDNSGVKASTIDANDLTITGPNGFSQKASLVTSSVSADGTTVTATYRMTAPGGMWDAADNGNYHVSLAAGAVSDIYDNLTAGATLAQFTAAVLNAVPVLQSYGSAQAGAAYLSLTIKSATAPIPMLVKGPGGFSAQVEILNTVAGANGGYVSTCRVLAPGGTWDYADNGSYTVVPKSTVNLAAGNVGTFAVNLTKPAPAPTGTLLGVSTTPAGNTYVEITLSYYNGTAISPSSFVPDQIQLVGPNGYVRTGQIYSKGNLDSKHVSVTYRFAAPGGTWDYTDNGTYSLYKITANGSTATVFGKITVKLATPAKATVRATTDEQIAKTGVVSGPWQQTPVNILADIMPLRLRVA